MFVWLAVSFSGRGSQEERLTRAAHSASLGSALPGGRVLKLPLVESCAGALLARQASRATTMSTRCFLFRLASFMGESVSEDSFAVADETVSSRSVAAPDRCFTNRSAIPWLSRAHDTTARGAQEACDGA